MFRNGSRESGFSFVELMMVAGLTMFISFGVSQFMLSIMQSSETMRFRGDAENYRFMARMALQNAKVCQLNAMKNLATKNIPSTPNKNFTIKFNNLEYPTGGVVMPISATPVKNIPSWVSDIRATKFTLLNSGATFKDYAASVEMKISKEGTLYGGSTLMRDFPIVFRTDSVGKITDCSAGESMELALPELKQVCDFINGTLSADGKSCTPPATGIAGPPGTPGDDRDEMASCTISGDQNINAGGIKNAVFIAKRSIIGGVPQNFVTMLRVLENSGGSYNTRNVTGILEASWSGGSIGSCDPRGGGCGGGSSAKATSTPAGVTGTASGYGVAPSCIGYWQVAPRSAGP
ncbi:MAG: hypothetical protein A4S09_00185 [Proteobacteria bacterium SG_bin7]|nr:MAG: hypothetical protein A4S09_00185 [Proteobacteria bacterium SG_bin7]